MKNLKNLIIVSALFGMAHGANAYEYEKDFEPVEKGDAEAQGIELVNGQLMVKSKDGRISDMEAPYTFVGTNTANFANCGFAVEKMADADSILLDKDNNNVYFTRSSTNGVYKMKVLEKKGLNGVPSQLEFFETEKHVSLLTIKDGIAYAQDKDGNTVDVGGETTASIPTVELPNSASTNLYSVSSEGYTYVLEKETVWPTVVKYDGTSKEKSVDWLALGTKKAKQMVAFDDDNIFILREDGKLYANGNSINEKDEKVITEIKRTQDGKGLLITSKDADENVKVSRYNVQDGKKDILYSKEEQPKPIFTHQSVKANCLEYFVNQKKIGYKTVE